MASTEELLKYENFSMKDMESGHFKELVRLTYLAEMFDFTVRNKIGEPIQITLTEKPEHFAKRPNSDT